MIAEDLSLDRTASASTRPTTFARDFVGTPWPAVAIAVLSFLVQS